jgi:hypothetical protein
MAHERSQYLIGSNVADGSNSTESGCPRHVRFTPTSDRIADILDWQFRAKNKHHVYAGIGELAASEQSGSPKVNPVSLVRRD